MSIECLRLSILKSPNQNSSIFQLTYELQKIFIFRPEWGYFVHLRSVQQTDISILIVLEQTSTIAHSMSSDNRSACMLEIRVYRNPGLLFFYQYALILVIIIGDNYQCYSLFSD